MAFIQLESWQAAPASESGAAAAFRALLPAGLDMSARRAAACAFSVLVHLCLLWFLVNRLADGAAADDRARQPGLTVFDVAPPGATPSEPAKDLQAAMAAARAVSIVDLSRPADLPPPEWTIARISAPVPAATGSSASADASDAGGAAGGSAPRLRQFVGFGDGIGGEMLLDRNMLEDVRQAAMRAFPEAKGTALIFLRVSPSGVVMGAVVKGGGHDIGLALRRELLGKKLFQMRSVIKESALVALPPVNLAANS